ncbi:DUF5336 domain-containing protein [Mycobacterium sp. 3519A]|uniref:DUF5336 domain-containing protein n=1 Tax=Mycobacterium sp. 3519A TaxID=2057184 RepID=UPI000C7B5AF6|nr:DUF5336 domain-containing protein [Mycobacterium sp. 3519A]
MVYSPGTRDYHSAYQPAYPTQRQEAESSLPRNLYIAIAVLGLATYVFNFGPVADGPETVGWDVRFATLAALCAMFGLLARRGPLSLAIAVLATMGFLDALSNLLAAGDAGWALTVIVVLNALQAIAAAAALLVAPKSAGQPDAAGYEAYVDYYNQAVRSYYTQHAQPAPPEQVQRAGYGQAQADARATARAQRSQRASQQGDYADLDYSDSRPTAPLHEPVTASGPTGLPSFGQARAGADQPIREAGESARPSSQA